MKTLLALLLSSVGLFAQNYGGNIVAPKLYSPDGNVAIVGGATEYTFWNPTTKSYSTQVIVQPGIQSQIVITTPQGTTTIPYQNPNSSTSIAVISVYAASGGGRGEYPTQRISVEPDTSVPMPDLTIIYGK